MNPSKRVTTFAALFGGLASGLFSAAASADATRYTGVGAHIADQGNRVLVELRQQAETAVKTAALSGLEKQLQQVSRASSQQTAMGGGGPTAPMAMHSSRYLIDSSCP